jgi:hypothetical protein
MRNSTQRTMLAVVAIVLALIAGVWWGGHPSDLPQFLRSAFTAQPNGSVVDEALADIEHDYLRRLRATQLQNNAISGAINGLGDPYAAYQTPAQFRHFGKAVGATTSTLMPTPEKCVAPTALPKWRNCAGV